MGGIAEGRVFRFCSLLDIDGALPHARHGPVPAQPAPPKPMDSLSGRHFANGCHIPTVIPVLVVTGIQPRRVGAV